MPRPILYLAVVLCTALAALALLAACGGGGSAGPAAAPPPVVSPAASSVAGGQASAPTPGPTASAPLPEIVTPGGGQGWRQAWVEPWSEPVALGGWVRHSSLHCRGGVTDPDLAPEGSFAAGVNWAAFNGPIGNLSAHAGALHIDSRQDVAGYALLTNRTWPVDRPLAVQATVDLQPDNGAWLGLALISDETDYRELALYTDYQVPGRASAGVWHPCMVEWGIGSWAPGPRTLRLEYTPGAEVCWRHYVDGALLAWERCDRPGAPLVNPARVGLYIVNLLAEGQRVPGYVRATVGPITVETPDGR